MITKMKGTRSEHQDCHVAADDKPGAAEHRINNANEIAPAQIPSHIPSGLIVLGILWILQNVPGNVDSVPLPSLYSGKDLSSSVSFLESAAYDIMERASTALHANDEISSKPRNIFPRRNVWELISSSSDVIPLRSKMNNGSYSQWPGGSGGMMMAASSSLLHHNHPQLSIETRLQKLEHHFNSLRVYDDDCRQRLLCEIAESPAKFAPLTSAFLDETRFNGDEKSLANKLLETNDGTKLLTYIEATQRGASRHGCEIWTYRCPRAASTMIDFKALLVWREISKWLTVKFVANKKHQK